MTSVVATVAALASSVLAGASTGIALASVGVGGGVRPRRSLRESGQLARRGGGCIALAAATAAIASVLGEDHDRPALALTCVAVMLLIAVASWLLLVEPDDDDPGETPDEPEWWPGFERELEAWTRQSRVPAGPRN
jgi:hypothetical protein